MVDLHNPQVADILDAAKRIVCNERSAHHGDTGESFDDIAAMWNIYLGARGIVGSNKIARTDVAQMLALLKKIRFARGDPMNQENFIDDVGYTSIAGMFSGAFPETQPSRAKLMGEHAIADLVRRVPDV